MPPPLPAHTRQAHTKQAHTQQAPQCAAASTCSFALPRFPLRKSAAICTLSMSPPRASPSPDTNATYLSPSELIGGDGSGTWCNGSA
eukprot:225489-Chlamydomonas_euryale.AAC.1